MVSPHFPFIYGLLTLCLLVYPAPGGAYALEAEFITVSSYRPDGLNLVKRIGGAMGSNGKFSVSSFSGKMKTRLFSVRGTVAKKTLPNPVRLELYTEVKPSISEREQALIPMVALCAKKKTYVLRPGELELTVRHEEEKSGAALLLYKTRF